MDTLDRKARSRLMSRIKGTRTGPELALRRILWAEGLRYRLHSQLPGKPDLVFGKAKVAVFVDGCFWHGCPIHGHLPKSNQDYWSAKLARNTARDQATNTALAAQGWLPIRLWEHEVRKELDHCVSRITEAVRSRSATRAGRHHV
jgi:DNA mismatch endonuclease (patch repair protein)